MVGALQTRRRDGPAPAALGLPIPRPALIVERKDQSRPLSAGSSRELPQRRCSCRAVPLCSPRSSLAAWLADKANAARFAGHAADLRVNVAEALRDEDVQRVLPAELTRAVNAVEVAPLAGRALRVTVAGRPPCRALCKPLLTGSRRDRHRTGPPAR